MKQLPLFRWFILAVLGDWLVTRTLGRLAIFVPKSPPLLLVYKGMTLSGQFASVFAVVLTYLAWVWLIGKLWKETPRWITLIAALLLGVSLASLFIAPTPYSLPGFNLLTLLLVGWLGYQIALHIRRPSDWGMLMPAFALSLSTLYLLAQTSRYLFFETEGQKAVTFLYHLGEILVVLSPLAILVSLYHRLPTVSRKLNLWTFLPSATFAAIYWFNPSMTGILAIWSIGISLFLPWPLYCLGLWAWVSVLAAAKDPYPSLSAALILLAAAGFAPQLSSQTFWGIMALFLLKETMEGWSASQASITALSEQSPVLDYSRG